ncbi:MAG: hypothetical protein AAGM84_10195 [Pseudomonadota bacterium]
MKRVLLPGVLAVSLSGCITTALLLADRSNGDPVSGHTIGTTDPKKILDYGDVRVRVAHVQSARNFPIPESRVFRFSWTPDAYAARNAALGHRVPTEADWNRELARYASLLRYPNAKPELVIRENKKRAARTKFKPYVAADGEITFCNDTWGGKYGCTDGITLSKAKQRELAARALAISDPDCRISVIDPPELTQN